MQQITTQYVLIFIRLSAFAVRHMGREVVAVFAFLHSDWSRYMSFHEVERS